jgi:hypothetical protein
MNDPDVTQENYYKFLYYIIDEINNQDLLNKSCLRVENIIDEVGKALVHE